MKTKQNHPKFDLVVTRHKPLVEWLLREGYIDESTPVVEHAHAGLNADVVTDDGQCAVKIGRQVQRLTNAEQAAARHNLANVRGKHVLGVLPHHLSCEAASITEVQLAWEVEDRAAMQAGDLDVEAVDRAARGLHTYVVQRHEGAGPRSLGRAIGEAVRFATALDGYFSLHCEMSDSHGLGGRDRPVIRCFDSSQQNVAEVDIWTGAWRGGRDMAALASAPWLDEFGREV